MYMYVGMNNQRYIKIISEGPMNICICQKTYWGFIIRMVYINYVNEVVMSSLCC